MPPRRWTMGRRTQCSEPIREYLRSGDYGTSGDPARPPFDYDSYELAGSVLRGHYTEIQELWGQHGAGILENWATEHPGRRPFAWWICTASEPRRVLRGAELLSPWPSHADRWWRPRFGVPYLAQVRPAGFTGYPHVESEATYCARLDLFVAGERARVPAEDWEPVAINPFLVDARHAAIPTPASTNGKPKRPAA